MCGLRYDGVHLSADLTPSKPGALTDLTSKFQSAGLGNILQSWIGTGQNLPISADQVSPSGKAPGANDLGGALASLGKLLG